ncbi:MAG: hypothetical protein COS85_02400 [Armatimonadetes bacterium CG07_land_8_20_14_0_80_59_28]|nr:MAG: hypothetical protein COS85_02400 [Armatimonadetes bacterium CG07_land_8_20_14_0_80_59_28]PIX42151.1 MAG: hypothetical protein COZ56_10050 [Armatimonadetes bacterium CG_4_8_14_3_um_filter_58_9]PJB64419.1 MAG: hypothetical protein CO095_14935 [Armatimonadetes bacterium CG_4_9_14_3_um_filter_58_7]
MNLLYKPDWEETQERFKAWWAREYFGRCGLAVTAPKDNPPDLPAPPEPKTPQEKWFDLDLISAWNEYGMSRCFYGGEAFPIWSAGYAGVSGIPALLGCPTDVDMATGWWNPILTDPERIDYTSVRLDESHPSHRFTMEMLHRAALESKGKSIPSIGAFGAGGDTLAALRGTEQLLVDCAERPDEVRAAEKYLMDMWCDFYDRCHEIIHGSAEGSTCWFRLWSPGKFYAAQNDFSYNISPGMFRDIFLPAIEQQTQFLDHCVYHVDGIHAFAHVDALCELPRLQAIQILPGAGKPSPLHYMDVLKKVQQAGKNLHVSIAADEVEVALSELSARGLFIGTYCETEDEALRLLKSTECWSRDV